MRARSHPPAWYPDPRDPERLRRWNGRSWTDEVRPLPDWLRMLNLSPGPGPAPRRAPRAGRWLWAVSAGLLALGGALVAVLSADGGTDPERIDDSAFLASADALCRLARDADSAAGYEAMVRAIRALEVRSADRDRVVRWLRDWDEWTSSAGDKAGTDEAKSRRAGANAAISRFAYVNGMTACILA